MVIEAARHLAGLEGANSTEFDPARPHPVIATMADQEDIVAGERRHGRHDAARAPTRRRWCAGSIVRRGVRRGPRSSERHRHRYEVNNAYRDRLAGGRPGRSPARPRTAGWSSSSSWPATCTRTSSATQAHPELRSPADPAAPAVRRAFVGRGAGLRGSGAGCRSTSRLRRPAGLATDNGRRRSRRRLARERRRQPSRPVRVERLHGPRLRRCAPTRCDARRRGQRPGDGRRAPGRGRRRRARRRRTGVVLIRQYRHPVGGRCRELPAGLLDVDGRGPASSRGRASWPRRPS